MSEKCELLDKCPFFSYYKRSTESIVQGWIELYCDDIEKSEQCERKKYRKATGKSPVHNMCPTGDLLK